MALAAGDRFVELAEHLERVAKVTARLRLAQSVTDRSVPHNQSHTGYLHECNVALQHNTHSVVSSIFCG